ncbi:hypothetical protein B0H11DRAFT_2218526 [Mycena galericulata]|nr:hypothetical protein B0H11DRAFT_2218526 [Mycena galericulata]
MPQPPSFLRSWRRKVQPQTSPTRSAPAVEVPIPSRSSNSSSTSARIDFKRRPSDTPSDSSTRFLRLFKGTYIEPVASVGTDATRASSSSYIMVRHSPSLSECTLPPNSPHSLDRPLPPVPPVRPPRPPSLDLDAIEFSVPLPPTSSKLKSPRQPHPRPLHPLPSTRHKMPELDDVWEGFMKDVEGEDANNFTIPPRRRHVSCALTCPVGSRSGAQAFLDPPAAFPSRTPLYRAWGSESTPYLAYDSGQISDSESEEEAGQGDVGFSLSLFPIPPPLPTRRRLPPKPLVLLPTPTIAPLPPSPSYSSRDSTPIATPTTPRSAEPSLYPTRKIGSPVSILKKQATSFYAGCPVPSPPDTPTTPTLTGGLEERRNSPHIPSPRLRSAQSVPHLQSYLLPTPNTHRNAASDTTPMRNNKERSIGRAKQQLVRLSYLQSSFILPSSSIQKRNLCVPRLAMWSGDMQFNPMARYNPALFTTLW